MKPESPTPLESEIDDFAEILKFQDANGTPVIVGGHAAGLWSRYYLAQGLSELAAYLPFRSKDLDLVGTFGLLEELQRRFKGNLLRSEPRSPVFGRIDIPQPSGHFLRVEVLHTVLGLSRIDLSRTVTLEISGVVGRIPMPQLILKAKIANAALIEQLGRQDVKHVRMMMLCVRAFIEEFAGFVTEGKASERMLINFLQETLEIVTSSHAIKAAELWGFHFEQIWPFATLRELNGCKVARWLEHRFPQEPGPPS